MSLENENAIAEAMRAARKKARGYADFFGWASNRDLEEQVIAGHLAAALNANGDHSFSEIKIRGRGNDPPDLEAVDSKGKRVAIEVTELVDNNAIKEFKAGRQIDWAEWNQAKFLTHVTHLLERKNKCFPKLKGSPYSGGYVVLIFTDEPELNYSTVKSFLAGHKFMGINHLHRAILLLSYDPTIGQCPYFELM